MCPLKFELEHLYTYQRSVSQDINIVQDYKINRWMTYRQSPRPFRNVDSDIDSEGISKLHCSADLSNILPCDERTQRSIKLFLTLFVQPNAQKWPKMADVQNNAGKTGTSLATLWMT